MLRWVATVLGVALAAGIGLVAGYLRWGREVVEVERVERRAETAASEADLLRGQKDELQQRLDTVSREQERLAHENEILRRQRVTEEVLGTPRITLPELPPK